MSVVTKAVLKSYFENGDFPTQAQFEDLIDTLFPGIIHEATLTTTGAQTQTTQISMSAAIGCTFIVIAKNANSSKSIGATMQFARSISNDTGLGGNIANGIGGTSDVTVTYPDATHANLNCIGTVGETITWKIIATHLTF